MSNSGTVTLAGTVTIEDDKIESGITCDAVPVGGLGPGGTVTCTGSYTTEQADVDGSEVVNRATATLAGVQSSEETERVTWLSTQGGQPTVELGVGAVSVVETAGSLTVGVRLSAASQQTVTVGYETADATATAGSDYTAVDSVLTFTAGTTVGTIEVAVTVPTGAEFTVEEAELTFAVGAWETAQTVTVRAGRDGDAVAAAAASIEHEVSGGDYAGEAAAGVAVTVLEADTAQAELTLGVRATDAHRHRQQRRGDRRRQVGRRGRDVHGEAAGRGERDAGGGGDGHGDDRRRR